MLGLLHSSILALLLCACTTVQAASPDAAITEQAQTRRFSGTILVQKDGRVRYLRSFGLANYELGVANTNRTVYRIASITKLFTSTLILQLHEAGRLDLNKTFGEYLPGYRGQAASQVTVHQLLNHTSGLPNIDRIPNIENTDEAIAAQLDDAAQHARLPIYQTPYSSDQLLEKFCSDPPVRPAGQSFDYNNADYIILGKIIEALYRKSYEEVLQERILRPLRLEHTGMARHARLVPGLADPYSLGADGKTLEKDMPVYPENWYAAGAMYSTAEDVLKFSNALFGGALLNAKSLALLTKPGLDRYGYGLWIYEKKIGGKSYRIAKRPGRIMGTRSELYRFLDSDLTVVILGNTGAADLDTLVAEVGRIMVES